MFVVRLSVVLFPVSYTRPEGRWVESREQEKMDAAISQISIDSIMMMEVDAAFDVRRSTDGPSLVHRWSRVESRDSRCVES